MVAIFVSFPGVDLLVYCDKQVRGKQGNRSFNPRFLVMRSSAKITMKLAGITHYGKDKNA